MARPRKNRIVAGSLSVNYFKPRGIPLVELEEIHLSLDEREALRLGDLVEMSYEDAGKAMGISRATFGRIIQQARKIVSDALINGKAIRIEGGSCTILEAQDANCGFEAEQKRLDASTGQCPVCARRLRAEGGTKGADLNGVQPKKSGKKRSYAE